MRAVCQHIGRGRSQLLAVTTHLGCSACLIFLREGFRLRQSFGETSWRDKMAAILFAGYGMRSGIG
jgi:hypothetical protein